MATVDAQPSDTTLSLGDDPAAPTLAAQRAAHAADNAPPSTTQLSLGSQMPPQPPLMSSSWSQIGKRLWDEGSRGVGLGTREVIEGLSSLPTMAADVATWLPRMGQRALGIPTTAPSDLVQKGLDVAGLPTPQTPTEQNIATINRGASAALVPLPGAGLATSGANLLRLGASGGAGALAADKVNQSDVVPGWAKPYAGLAAAMLAGKAADVSANLGIKGVNAIAGNTSDIYNAFQRADIPTKLAGTIAGGEGGQEVEAAAARVPFGSQVIRPVQQETVDAFGNSVARTAQHLDPAGNAISAQTTGETLQDAARAWKDKFLQVDQPATWNPIDQRLAGTSVNLTGYGKALDDVVGKLSLPETQKLLTPGLAMQLRLALTKDVPGGVVQWDTAGNLRSAIGQMMGVPEIAQSVGMDALKRAYGGLASDMRNTAVANGQGGVFDAANAASTAGHAFMDRTLSKLISKNNAAQETITPEQATNRVLQGGDTTMQELRGQLPDATDVLAAYKLRNMSLASPGTATAYDDTSTGRFLTGVNKLRQNTPGGYQALYGQDPAVAQQLADLSTAAGRLRMTERNLNTSGTAQQLGWMQYLKGILDPLGEMNVKDAVKAAVIPPAAGLGVGKVLTSPAFTRYAAAQGGGPPTLPPSRVGLLGTVPQLAAGQ